MVGLALGVFLHIHHLPLHLVLYLVFYACFGRQQEGTKRVSRASGGQGHRSRYLCSAEVQIAPDPHLLLIPLSSVLHRLSFLGGGADPLGKWDPLFEKQGGKNCLPSCKLPGNFCTLLVCLRNQGDGIPLPVNILVCFPKPCSSSGFFIMEPFKIWKVKAKLHALHVVLSNH